MHILEARRRWPDFKREIKADQEYLKELGSERRELQSGQPKNNAGGWFTTYSSTVKQMLGNILGTAKESEEVLIVECWVKDYTKVKEDDVSFDKYTGNIRRITTCNGGELVLDDRNNPSINPLLLLKPPLEEGAPSGAQLASQTHLYDKYPYILTQSITDTSNPWGTSDFENLSQLNVEINKSLSQFNMYKDKAARLKLINPRNSGVPNKAFTNTPGIIRPVNHVISSAIRYLDGPKSPPDVKDALALYRELFFLVAGTFELELAQTPGREVVAYKAIAALLERATTMMKGKIRNYGGLIRERGRMYISCAQNWYTDARWISYENEGEEFSQEILGYNMIAPYKLTVVSGSTMPISKVQEREEAISLFERGAIDNEELLMKLDWQDWKTVARRIKEGPFSKVMERMGALGAPEQLVELFNMLFQMDDKEFEKAMEAQELPSIPEIVAPAEQEEEKVPPEMVVEIATKEAEIDKTEAETKLVYEKIRTERVQQLVATMGIEFDKEKLKIERADLVNEIKQRITDGEREDKVVSRDKKRGSAPYKEKGLKSNNQKK